MKNDEIDFYKKMLEIPVYAMDKAKRKKIGTIRGGDDGYQYHCTILPTASMDSEFLSDIIIKLAKNNISITLFDK
jgi:hypothetical protein